MDPACTRLIPYGSSQVYIGKSLVPPEGVLLNVGSEFSIGSIKLSLTLPDGATRTNDTTSIPIFRCDTLPEGASLSSFVNDETAHFSDIGLCSSNSNNNNNNNNDRENEGDNDLLDIQAATTMPLPEAGTYFPPKITLTSGSSLSSLPLSSFSSTSSSELHDRGLKRLTDDTDLAPPTHKKDKKPPPPPPPPPSAQQQQKEQGQDTSLLSSSPIVHSVQEDTDKNKAKRTDKNVTAADMQEDPIKIYLFGVWALKAVKLSKKYAKVYERHFYQSKYGMSISTIENKVKDFIYKTQTEVCNDFVKIASDTIVVNIGNKMLCSLALEFYGDISRLFNSRGVKFRTIDFSEVVETDNDAVVTLDDFASPKSSRAASRRSSNIGDNYAFGDINENPATITTATTTTTTNATNNNTNNGGVGGDDDDDDDDDDINRSIINENSNIIGLINDPIADSILQSIAQDEQQQQQQQQKKRYAHRTSPKKAHVHHTELHTDFAPIITEETNDIEMNDTQRSKSKEFKSPTKKPKKANRKPKQPTLVTVPTNNVKANSTMHRSESYEYLCIGVDGVNKRKHSKEKLTKEKRKYQKRKAKNNTTDEQEQQSVGEELVGSDGNTQIGTEQEVVAGTNVILKASDSDVRSDTITVSVENADKTEPQAQGTTNTVTPQAVKSEENIGTNFAQIRPAESASTVSEKSNDSIGNDNKTQNANVPMSIVNPVSINSPQIVKNEGNGTQSTDANLTPVKLTKDAATAPEKSNAFADDELQGIVIPMSLVNPTNSPQSTNRSVGDEKDLINGIEPSGQATTTTNISFDDVTVNNYNSNNTSMCVEPANNTSEIIDEGSRSQDFGNGHMTMIPMSFFDGTGINSPQSDKSRQTMSIENITIGPNSNSNSLFSSPKK